jgi:4-hydroxythreonine-4-phosphate dehydrogenase (EC 1.1.1.262)
MNTTTLSNFKPKIGITTGDINGIGIELIIKAFAEHHISDYCTPVVFASNKVLNYYKNLLKENNVQYSSTKDLNQLHAKGINVFACWDEEVPINPGVMNDTGGKYAVRSLQVATQCLKDGQLDGIVTNPIHKSNVQKFDFPYTGHTPFLKEKFQVKDVAMMMCADRLRIALLTEHLPLSEVSKNITTDKIIQKVKLIHDSLIKDFGIDKPKIAILGLNPHAGDDGTIGKEEVEIILPAIEKLKQEQLLVFGPYAADGFFARSNELHFDCTLAMYHDQGLIPFKRLDAGLGVNFTAGLPVVRTSPDHGTAFDIAGKNKADISSFLQSIFLCIDIIRQRHGYAENTSNPLIRGTYKTKIRRTKEDIEE